MKLYYSCLVVLLICTASSCKKWLEVQPEDKFTEDQIYATPSGIAEVLNGLYLKMGSDQLYGQNLTLDKLDLFAQRYYSGVSELKYYQYAQLNYTDETVKATIQTIWDDMYQLIGNANLFLTQLDKHPGILTTEKEQLYKGEAIAIRSLAYFDLLRLFGPIYATDSTTASIPYYTVVSSEIGAFLPATTVLQNILNDLATAESYLKNDPIVSESGTVNYNNYRLHLYAVKALKARVLLWRGSEADKALALQTAKDVIAVASKFPWITHTNITGNSGDADRIFSTEVLFGVFNSNLYQTYDVTFSPVITELNIISTGPLNFVSKTFENNSSDYRFEYSWPFPSEGVTFRTFIKYRDLVTKTLTRRFTVPVMRLSELYYIAAEAETNPTQALAYLNTVRRARNLGVDITDYSLFSQELTKEYVKEFYGEGQLWYYYKRRKLTTVSSPNTTSGTTTIALSKYVLPIPDSETKSR